MISIVKEQSYYCTYTFTLDLNLNTYMIELMFHKQLLKIYLSIGYILQKITLPLQKKNSPHCEDT